MKNENSYLSKESDQSKNELLSREKKLIVIESECEKLKKIVENFNKYKNERENLILENAKFESEINRLKVDQEENQILLEKQMIILRNRDETVNKLTEEINYLNFNTKKLKQDADRSIQDAVIYQQIVRKIEKDLKESENRREKVENELKIIREHMGFKK